MGFNNKKAEEDDTKNEESNTEIENNKYEDFFKKQGSSEG